MVAWELEFKEMLREMSGWVQEEERDL